MDRSTEKIDGSHERMVFRMQGTVERDKWCKTFPNPCPGTHRLTYSWRTDMELVVELVPIGSESSGVVGPAADSPVEAGRVALAAKLTAMSDADLETHAAERGIHFDPKKHKSKAQRVAAVVEREADKP